MKILIVGAGGRESAFATKLMLDSTVYAVIDHKNPTIIDCVEKSGGEWKLGKSSDPKTVTSFALENKIDLAFISSDEPLANGVVDSLLNSGIEAIGGTQEATKIEWDKVYSISMVKELCPEFTPLFHVITTIDELNESLAFFEKNNIQIVVKPQGLTGGKGVKVMPIHLKSYKDAFLYVEELLNGRPNEKVLLVEKLEGIEFTIMGFTDGKNLVLCPASYDYPFRYEGDKGAGTGGMGCFTNSDKKLPFMTDEDLEACRIIMQKVIDRISNDNLLFNGILNGGFFKTKQGIKFMEFNGRFGDPEALNILSVLGCSFSKILEDILHGNLKTVPFIKKASVVKYLVAKEYPSASPTETLYNIDIEKIEEMGIKLFCSSTEKLNAEKYTTLKRSRVIALTAVDDSIISASNLINKAIDNHVHGDLEYRPDIGQESDILNVH